MKKFVIFTICIVLLILNAKFAMADLSYGLVAYYPFNGNANDESGNNNNGTANEGVSLTNDKFGNAESAYFFNGVDGRIKLNKDAMNELVYFTISLWIKISYPNSAASIISAANTSTHNEILIHFYDTEKYCIVIKDQPNCTNSIDISINKWHYISITRSDSIIKFYLDGSLVSEKTVDAHKISVANNGLWLGGDQDVIGGGWQERNQFKGVMDEIRIYNRSLSESEVKLLFSEDGYSINNSLSGKVVTSQEILGYSACVGGATIKALPHELTTVSNIYGEFNFLHLPEGQCIIEIESSYFQTLTKSIRIDSGKNTINDIEIFKPKCQNMFTQQEIDKLINQVKDEKDSIILEKEQKINQLTESIDSMYTQEYLDKAILEAEKRGELKYDLNGDGKVGLEEVIKYLETLSGVRVESLIIFPDSKQHILSK